MPRKKSISAKKIIEYLVASTPNPQKYTGDPETTTLGSLGINATTTRGFVRGVQSKVTPWLIDSNNILTHHQLSVQECAQSLEKMVSKPPLDPDELVDIIVKGSPFPKKYNGDRNSTTLAMLGVNGTTANGFVTAIQEGISPWLVNQVDVVVAGNKTVQDCAFSVNNHAY